MKSQPTKIGIIGGSGVEDLLFTHGFRSRKVKTIYGAASIKEGQIDGKAIVFVNRHAPGYTPPGLINYRGIIAVFQKEKVGQIIATGAVGSLDHKMKPGSFTLISDFIDFTRHRVAAFHNDAFIDLTQPYSPYLGKMITKAADKIGLRIHQNSVYVCTEGPRFESKAEIRMYAKLGARVVGMTQVPEVVLAAEARIPYSAIGVVTNFAAGVSNRHITASEVIVVMKEKAAPLSELILQTIKLL